MNNTLFRSIVEDEDLFPVFVSLGYDVYGLSEPLYWTDNMTINPDGSIEHEDDLEDMINEVRNERTKGLSTKQNLQNDEFGGNSSSNSDYLDSDEDIDFSETVVGTSIHEFCESSQISRDYTNYINFALVGVLDTFDPNNVSESALIDAAIDAGRFASKQVSKSGFNFSEDNTNTVVNTELYDILVGEFDAATELTLRALSYTPSREELKDSIGKAYEFVNSQYEPSLPDVVKSIHAITGLTSDDLARTAIRLKCGKIQYNSLPTAAILSSLAFSNYDT